MGMAKLNQGTPTEEMSYLKEEKIKLLSPRDCGQKLDSAYRSSFWVSASI